MEQKEKQKKLNILILSFYKILKLSPDNQLLLPLEDVKEINDEMRDNLMIKFLNNYNINKNYLSDDFFKYFMNKNLLDNIDDMNYLDFNIKDKKIEKLYNNFMQDFSFFKYKNNIKTSSDKKFLAELERIRNLP
jgi:hypothetical protein